MLLLLVKCKAFLCSHSIRKVFGNVRGVRPRKSIAFSTILISIFNLAGSWKGKRREEEQTYWSIQYVSKWWQMEQSKQWIISSKNWSSIWSMANYIGLFSNNPADPECLSCQSVLCSLYKKLFLVDNTLQICSTDRTNFIYLGVAS